VSTSSVQWRRQDLEQRKLVPERHRLEDEAVFVDEPEPGERLREGRTPRAIMFLPGSRITSAI
jgi:hypothetical protein